MSGFMKREGAMYWQGRDLMVQVLSSQAGVATQILIQAGGTRFLVDAGDGIVRDLLRVDVAPQSLAGVFLTHGHVDSPGAVAVTILGEPVGSALWAWVIFGERVGPWQALGCLIVLFGIAYTARTEGYGFETDPKPTRT